MRQPTIKHKLTFRLLRDYARTTNTSNITFVNYGANDPITTNVRGADYTDIIIFYEDYYVEEINEEEILRQNKIFDKLVNLIFVFLVAILLVLLSAWAINSFSFSIIF